MVGYKIVAMRHDADESACVNNERCIWGGHGGETPWGVKDGVVGVVVGMDLSVWVGSLRWGDDRCKSDNIAWIAVSKECMDKRRTDGCDGRSWRHRHCRLPPEV